MLTNRDKLRHIELSQVDVGALTLMIDVAKTFDVALLLVDAAYGFEMEMFEFLNGWLFWRRGAAQRVSVERGPFEARAEHAGHGVEILLRWRRGAVAVRHPAAQIPDRARHHDVVRRHEEDLAPRLPQRALGTAERGADEPEGEPRADSMTV